MFSKKKDTKLSKMKMPADPSGDAALDVSDMAPDDMGAELTDSEDGSHSAPAASGDLEGASDDDLMAEVKKRGLMSKLGNDKLMGENESDESASY